MPLAFLLLLIFPAAALVVVIRRRVYDSAWGRSLAVLRVVLLSLIGATLAAPLVTKNAAGSGESYNYSLALGDALTQIHAGEFPPLVGQTQYAWNGRIHPLRNAPYLFYLGAALDTATFQNLPVWEIQNLSLAFSLFGLVFSTYGSLRLGCCCRSGLALLLTATFAASPPVLGALYGMNLLMTLHAAVFVPIALGAVLHQFRFQRAAADWVLCFSLAATWWAHPPVALWLTLLVGPIRLVAWIRQPSLKVAGRLILVATVFGGATAYLFASVISLGDNGGLPVSGTPWDVFVAPIMDSVTRAFPDSIKPVSPDAGEISDLQYGLLGWMVLIAGVAWGVGNGWTARRTSSVTHRPVLIGAGLTLLLAAWMISLCLPIPIWTVWWWTHLPLQIHALTHIWPMQRIYLVALAASVLAVGLICSEWPPAIRTIRQNWRSILAVAGMSVLLTFQAMPFVKRGWRQVWSAETTRQRYSPSNLDLTVTSFAFLNIPRTFNHGYMDPQFQFSVSDVEGETRDVNIEAALAGGTLISQGRFIATSETDAQPWRTVADEPIVLQPGRRYLLDLEFKVSALKGTLDIIGSTLNRVHLLGEGSGSQGFGLAPGQRHALSVFTSQETPETVDLHLRAERPTESPPVVAAWRLLAFDPALLPVRLEELFPLRFSSHFPKSGTRIITPRRFVPGYFATVNGRPITPRRSPDGSVMITVPRGDAVVELHYRGPPWLRELFWLSATVWSIGLLLALLGNWIRLDQVIIFWSRKGLIQLRRHRLKLTTGTLAVITTGAIALKLSHLPPNTGFFYGPVEITSYLPFQREGYHETLLSTGREGAGSTVFLAYENSETLRLGVEDWGRMTLSDPIEYNPYRPHKIVINSNVLSPPNERSARPPPFKVIWDGTPVVNEDWSVFPSTEDEIVVAQNSINSTAAGGSFTGQIVKVRRVSNPQEFVLAPDQKLDLELTLPPSNSATEEILLEVRSPVGRGELRVLSGPNGRQRFVFKSGEEPRQISRDLTRAKGNRGLKLQLAFEAAAPDSLGLLIKARVEGRDLFTDIPGSNRSAPVSVRLSSIEKPVDSALGLFRGEIKSAAVHLPWAPGRFATGPLQMNLLFPSDKVGRQEPLLVSGQAGAGDLIFVIYDAPGQIRLGLDHWLFPAHLSDPIHLDLSLPHQIEISTGVLYPPVGDSAWRHITPAEQARLANRVFVKIDGAVVLEAEVTVYPATQNQITIGSNLIGGSTADPAFSGHIFQSRWLGWPR